MSTKTHHADWTVEMELPTQRWELQQLGAWDNTYGQLVKMDYATDATEGWCDAQDVAKLESDLAQMQRRVEEMQKQRDAAVSAIVYLTSNYGGKLHNSWYAEHPELGALIAAEDKRWEEAP